MPTLRSKEVQKCQWDQAKFLSRHFRVEIEMPYRRVSAYVMPHEHSQSGDAVRFRKRLAVIIPRFNAGTTYIEGPQMRRRRTWASEAFKSVLLSAGDATLIWKPRAHSCEEVPTSSTRTSNMRDLACLQWSCLGNRRTGPFHRSKLCVVITCPCTSTVRDSWTPGSFTQDHVQLLFLAMAEECLP